MTAPEWSLWKENQNMSKHPTPAERARTMLRSSGYATGGDVKQDKAMIKSAVRQHETAQHGGKHSPLKLARGGSVKKPSTTVNVIVAPSSPSSDAGGLRDSMQRGMHASPMGAGAAPMAPPRPPGAAPMGAPPPPVAPVGMAPSPLGMPPRPPNGAPFKRGGTVKGAGTNEWQEPRKRGGRVKKGGKA